MTTCRSSGENAKRMSLYVASGKDRSSAPVAASQSLAVSLSAVSTYFPLDDRATDDTPMVCPNFGTSRAVVRASVEFGPVLAARAALTPSAGLSPDGAYRHSPKERYC